MRRANDDVVGHAVSLVLATETLPSFGRGKIKNDEIGSIVPLPAMIPRA